jgi:hypothetical protein
MSLLVLDFALVRTQQIVSVFVFYPLLVQWRKDRQFPLNIYDYLL